MDDGVRLIFTGLLPKTTHSQFLLTSVLLGVSAEPTSSNGMGEYISLELPALGRSHSVLKVYRQLFPSLCQSVKFWLVQEFL